MEREWIKVTYINKSEFNTASLKATLPHIVVKELDKVGELFFKLMQDSKKEKLAG